MRRRRILRAIGLAAGLGLGAAGSTLAQEPPPVVASIVPIHALVAGVMQGVGEPALLVKGVASPHAYSLKPSEARLLNGARIVFWVGDEMEVFLVKPLKALPKDARVVALARAEGLTLLPAREGGPWEGHDHKAARSGHKHAHKHGERDMHVWLDPGNAGAMVERIVAALSEVDKPRSATYRANGDRLKGEIDGLDREMRAALAPVASVPFIVFHDAYQYLERRYGLNAVGSITVSPERPPGAKRLAELRDRVVAVQARCVFAEPQSESALVGTVVEGTPARIGRLDPEGALLEPGPDAYAALLRGIARSLVACLSPPS